MSTLRIEINEIFSTFPDTQEFLLQIRSEESEYFEYKYPSSLAISIPIDFHKKEFKLYIKLLKDKSILGNAEVLLSQNSFFSKDNSILRWISMIPVSGDSSKKQSTVGSALVSMSRVQCKFTLIQGEQIRNKSADVSNNSRVSSVQFKDKDEDKEKERTVRKKSSIKKSNQRYSQRINTDENRPERFLNQEKYDEIESLPNIFNQFIESLKKSYNHEFFENLKNLNSEEELKLESKTVVYELFNMHENYLKSFSDSISLNNAFKILLKKYGNLFKSTNKKQNFLKNKIESLNLNNIEKVVNFNKENEKIKEQIEIYEKEIKLVKNLFRIEYSAEQLEKYKLNQNRDKVNDKEKLLKSTFSLYENKAKYSKLTEENRKKIEKILQKNNIIELISKVPNSKEDTLKLDDRGTPNEKTSVDMNNSNIKEHTINKIELSDDEDEDVDIGVKQSAAFDTQHRTMNSEVGNTQNELIQGNSNSKRRSSIDFVLNQKDKTDLQLNNYLNDFYAKKRVSQIPFKRLSEGNYEFGTQKVMVKMEKERIVVRVGGGYLLLDKFIEMNAPIEDAKLMKAKNVTNKFSRNVCVKKAVGGKAIYTLEKQSKSPDNRLITSIK